MDESLQLTSSIRSRTHKWDTSYLCVRWCTNVGGQRWEWPCPSVHTKAAANVRRGESHECLPCGVTAEHAGERSE